MRSSRAVLTALLVFALAASEAVASDAANPCAVPPGGKVAAEDPSGIGGTGAAEAGLLASGDDESGMGGTGLGGPDGAAYGDDDSGVGGTGVVGTITGFGSICVNGLRITYGAQTPTERNGSAASAAELAIGDVVHVAAQRDSETGDLRARSIGVRHIVRGPIESVSPGDAETALRGSLVVMGQRVVLPAQWDPEMVNELVPGDHVAISGHRLGDGRILSSRLVLLETRDVAALIGTLERLEDGRLRVAGVDVVAEFEHGDGLAGRYVVATGTWDPQTRSIRSAEVAAAASFEDMSVREVSLGGYVEESDAEGLRVGGVRVDVSAAKLGRPKAIALDDYIVIRAVVTKSGAVRAVRIALDARPPRLLIPRPPRIDRVSRPKRMQRQRIQRPALPPRPPRPPRIDTVPKPVRVLKQISG